MAKYIKELFYITHIDNVPSILRQGILSHEVINAQNLSFTPIYDEDIVSRRSLKTVPGGQSLWAFANLYFQPRNAMLYRVIHEKTFERIVVIGVRKDVMSLPGALLTDGNAASSPTKIIPKPETRKADWDEIIRNTQREWWSEADGSKRKIMAECLIPQKIPPDYVQNIYTANLKIKEKVEGIINTDDINVIPEANMFFQPSWTKQLTNNLSLIEGDMFFSKQQTLTVSVNCVGVMGKGLASRAKYQFPDVYVHYQDLCRQKRLRLGTPSLYKRESSPDIELADEPGSMKNGTSEAWFLLFPTKDNWRNRADIKGIKRGLQWVCDNYRKEGIKSLAMPALGCGLGWLDWSAVGPLLCTYLSRIDIQTWVYLPTERRLPDELLGERFLLNKNL
ncbi:MAG TPA: DUF4433 domain-containing protein [Planctomycetes bacterium]|nr:DUF4433 domain-containing protein [Planctomycetota bacterium]